jgi:hypothetical protein
MNIDKLIYDREQSRLNKNWKESDRLRDLLDSLFVFVFDTKEGQEVYHRTKGDRDSIKKEIAEDIRADKNFEAYLFTVRSSNDYRGLFNS